MVANGFPSRGASRPMLKRLRTFWSELMRRRVVGTAVAYVVGAWVIVEVSSTVFPALLLPEWTVRFVTVLAILGFPVVLVLAWFFDIERKNYDQGAGAPPEKEETASTTLPPVFDTAEASVAVLPFEALSPGDQGKFLAEGIAAELQSTLAKLHRLRVVARRSSFALGRTDADVRQIGQALNAQYVIAGSVFCDDQRLRVIASLDSTIDGDQVWTETYDRDADHLLAVQRDIAEQIAGAFGGVQLREEIRAATLGSTDNQDAWSLVQRARSYLMEFTPESLDTAVSSLREAVALDEGYAAAHATLSSVLGDRAINGFSADAGEDLEAALAAAERAKALAPDDVFVMKMCGIAWAYAGQIDRSLEELRRVVTLAPFDLGAWGYLGWPLVGTGDPASLDEVQEIMPRLLAAAPDHPGAPFWEHHRSVAYSCAGQHADAVVAAASAIEKSSGFPLAWMQYANALGAAGRSADAGEALERASRLSARMTPDFYEQTVRRMSADDVVAARRLEGIPRA